MRRSLLIIINGLPCSGKTTIGRHIADAFGLPFLYKDAIKEIIFDTLGWKDRHWSRSVSRCAFAMLFFWLETVLKAKGSAVIEGNFQRQEHTGRFASLQRQYDVTAVEILCRAEGRTLWRRFRQRAASASRHPGHVDEQTLEELKPSLLLGRSEPLGVADRYIEVDTTDFGEVDLNALLKHLGSCIG